jgi:hypothetical protein
VHVLLLIHLLIQQPLHHFHPSFLSVDAALHLGWAGKLWRSQAISLDGLLDYEEDDREVRWPYGTHPVAVQADNAQGCWCATRTALATARHVCAHRTLQEELSLAAEAHRIALAKFEGNILHAHLQEATVELSLAAEALQEALAMDYGGALCEHLLAERWLVIHTVRQALEPTFDGLVLGTGQPKRAGQL